MAIYRGRLPGDSYTMVPTAWLRDPNLSLTAKGVLVFLATVPQGRSVTPEDILGAGRADSAADIIGVLADLEETGYLRRDSRGDLWLSAKGGAI